MNDTGVPIPPVNPIIAMMPMIILILAVIGIIVWLSRRSARKAREQTQPAINIANELERLSKLKKDGILKDEDFEEAKKALLTDSHTPQPSANLIWPSNGVLVLAGLCLLYDLSPGVSPLSVIAVTLTLIPTIWWYVVSKRTKRRQSFRLVGYLLFFIGFMTVQSAVGILGLQVLSYAKQTQQQFIPLTTWIAKSVITLPFLLLAVPFFIGAYYLVFQRATSSHFPSAPRSKTTAVLLAVFLGLFTWCYTYKRDAWKFWVNLGLSLATLGIFIIVSWIWAVIDVAVKPDSFYSNYPNKQ